MDTVVLEPPSPFISAVTVVESKKVKKIAICGFAASYTEAPVDDPDVEIWICNELYRYIKRWDRIFELHSRDVIENETDPRNKEHVTWLRAQPVGKPIFMQQTHGDIPASVAYPLEEMKARFGSYFSSSIGYMLAMAIAEGASWIGLYGIDLASDTEYHWQRPNAEYFIGLARGIGIDVYIAKGAALLKSDHLYGFESEPAQDGPLNEAFFKSQIKLMNEKRDQTIAQLNTYDGYLEMCVNCLKMLSYSRRGVDLSTVIQGKPAS